MDHTRNPARAGARRASLAGVGALLAVLAFPSTAAGTAADADASAAVPCDVVIAGFAFNPSTCDLAVGETVTWSHQQAGATHTVTSDDGRFPSSGFLQNGSTYGPITFTEAGTYPYHCQVHPFMTGTVNVT